MVSLSPSRGKNNGNGTAPAAVFGSQTDAVISSRAGSNVATTSELNQSRLEVAKAPIGWDYLLSAPPPVAYNIL